jgi:hypothetical protein
MLADFGRRGLGDGLPLVPPAEELVDRFVTASGREPGEVLGAVPPQWGECTVEKIAVNAAMAGCEPRYMPVVTAAVEAMLEEEFNLFALQATTHPGAPLVLVSGPGARGLGINAGTGAFGPGFRANATIGRAVRLILLNIGGARPGAGDQSTQAQPSKFTYCAAENEQETPWETHRAHLGAAVDETVVVVAALESPHNINDHGSYSAEQILTTVAHTMATSGSNSNYLGVSDSFLFLCPEHAAVIAGDGMGRGEIQDFLFAKARIPPASIGLGQRRHLAHRHLANPRYAELDLGNPELSAWPVLSCPEDLNVVVVGGPGKHSSFAPPTGTISRSVVKKVRFP